MIDFTGHVAVVTGAGRGLGRLYALDLARRGAAVVVNDLGGSMRGDGADSRVADDVVDEITKAGGTAVASYDSVDSPAGGQAIVDAAVDAFGRLDAVVSNAGIFGSVPFEDLSPDDVDPNAARTSRRRLLPGSARVSRDEEQRAAEGSCSSRRPPGSSVSRWRRTTPRRKPAWWA